MNTTAEAEKTLTTADFAAAGDKPEAQREMDQRSQERAESGDRPTSSWPRS
jgi:hypothetical protein